MIIKFMILTFDHLKGFIQKLAEYREQQEGNLTWKDETLVYRWVSTSRISREFGIPSRVLRPVLHRLEQKGELILQRQPKNGQTNWLSWSLLEYEGFKVHGLFSDYLVKI